MAAVAGKGPEIEGALRGRAVLKADVPAYPEWLKSDGAVENVVRLAFCVSPAGDVVGNSVELDLASGNGRLDRLSMEALGYWQFGPLAGRGNQCGTITFRFELAP